MRIAQLSLEGYFNYGNILQKFALHHTLKKFTDFAEVLWASPISLFPESGERPHLQCVLREDRHDYWATYLFLEAVRQSKFKDFDNLHISTRFNIPYIEEVADEYDFFVVGSDQVWNPGWHPPYIFLEFVPQEKKIAYAASIGAAEIPDNKKEIFRRGISNFKRVSVREENAAKLINELIGQMPTILPDPVLLLTEDEWLALAQKPTWFKEKYRRGYVLTYLLKKLPPPEVKNFADKFNLPVINLLDMNNYNHYTVGPAEFIWLFAHSTLTFTNSFHGAAFSLLFKRPFIVSTLREKNDKRLASFLKLFGLEDRTAPAAPLTIDFRRRDELLPIERAKAFNFLSEALGVEPREKFGGGDAL